MLLSILDFHDVSMTKRASAPRGLDYILRLKKPLGVHSRYVCWTNIQLLLHKETLRAFCFCVK